MFSKRFILYLFGAVLAGSMGYWFLFNRSERPSQRTAFGSNTPVVQKQTAVRSIVHLYFMNRDNTYLVAEKKEILQADDPVSFAKTIVADLIEGPNEMVRTLPADTKLRALFIDQNKTAYVDLSGSVQGSHPGGIQSELFTIYSIVNSLVLNSPEIDRVKILIAGHESITLAGHVDIRFPFKANMLLIR